MIKVVIIEDEDLAVEGMRTQLGRLPYPVSVVATLDSVANAVQWFGQHPAPDLALVDVQLSDGLSFEIFEKVAISCPVVFTTAYDAYALRAFQVQSIDYLLKPVSLTALEAAFDKYRQWKGPSPDWSAIQQLLQRQTPQYKERFLIKIGDRLVPVTLQEVDYFFSEHKVVWMQLQSGRKYLVDYTLEELEDLLDPVLFFRLNRSCMVCFQAIKEVVNYSNSRLKVQLKTPPHQDEIIVSREKAEAFRIWLGK